MGGFRIWLRKRFGRRARIVTVGIVNDDGTVRGWSFNSGGFRIPAVEILQDGSTLIAGWPLEELRKLASCQEPES